MALFEDLAGWAVSPGALTAPCGVDNVTDHAASWRGVGLKLV
jgi:hypothetical protein